MIDQILNIFSLEMLTVGIVISVFAVFLAYKWPDIVFLLGLPALLFLGQLKNIFPISVSGSATFFPFIAVVGKTLRDQRVLFTRFECCENLLIGLALLMVYSVSYSTYPVYGREKAILFCFMVVPIVLFSHKVITNVRLLHRSMSVITISFVIYVIWSALLLGSKGDFSDRTSSLNDVTVAGQFLGVAAIICFVHTVFGRYKIAQKVFYFFLMIISLLLLLLSGTRAALVAYVLTLLFLYWFVYADWFQRIFNKPGKTYTIIISMVMIMFVMGNILPQHILDRFNSIEAIFSNFESNEISNWQESKGRTVNYFSAIKGFISHPFGGVGIGGYESVLIHYGTDLYINPKDQSVHSYPHNLILEIAVEQGVVGLSLILYILYLNFKKILSLRKYIHRDPSHRWIISCCVSIYIYGFLVSMTSLDIPRMMILWWGMGLLLTADRIYNSRPLSWSKCRKTI
jgi:O-antigen ligase